MYEFESRVRYSETDAEGVLRLDALVNYLQDSSTFQSEELGLGMQYLRDNGIAWVLNFWQIDLTRLPRLTDKIIIGTIPYQVKGFMGQRNYYMKDAATGEILVKANTVWTLIDREKITPARVDSKMIEFYSDASEKLDMEYLPRKISLTGDFYEAGHIAVTEHMLDTNYHVNNEQYIEMSLPFIPSGKIISRITVEYKESAYLGDVLVPYVYESEDSLGVSLNKEGKDTPCAKCKFYYS